MKGIAGVGNERGGALAYALLVFMVLSVSVAIVVGYLANSRTNVQKDAHVRKANALAVGGMETFLSYLREYNSGMNISPTAYVRKFTNGAVDTYQWGTSDADGLLFRTPEGENVRLQFIEKYVEGTADEWDRMTVTCRATVGDRNSVGEISYVFSTTEDIPTSGGGGGGAGGGTGPAPSTEVSTDPNIRICTDEQYMVYYQGEYDPRGSKIPDPNATDSGDVSIRQAISKSIDAYKAIIDEKRQEVLAEIQAAATAQARPPSNELIDCSCNNLSDLKAVIDAAALASNKRPIAIRLTNWLNLQGTSPIEVGGPGKEVVLIGNLNVSTNVKIYGNLFTDGINFNGGNSFEVTGHLSSSSNLQTRDGMHLRAGSVSTNGDLTAKGPVTVQGDIYAKNNVTQNGDYALSFRHLYTDGELQLGSNAVAASGTIFSAKNMLIGNTNSFAAEHLLSYSKLILKSSTLNISGRVFVGPYNNTNTEHVSLDFDPPKGTINAGFILVNGKMQSNGGVEVNVTGGNVDGEQIMGDFIARAALMSSSNTEINTRGDFLVETKLESNGGFDLDIGGRWAFGTYGRFNGNTTTIRTGGEPSSFFLEGEINPCATGGGGDFSFDPVRAT